MPPSRQSQAQQAQQPPPQQPNFEDVAAALAAGTAASTAAAASPAAAGAVTATAGALTAAQIAQTSRAVVQKMMDWTKNRWNYMLDPSGPLSQTVKAEYPNQRVRDVMALLDEREREYEREFRRKMRKRLQEDIPAALSLPTMKERKDALKRIFEREKRYTAMREEAILARAMGALEAALLQDLSPEGAYWKLSPTVREHTLDCLAMGEKFWPWSVLRKIQPPLHYGCPCFLLGLDEAIDEGLMTRDQVPNEADARERYAKLADQIDDLRDLDEQAVEELHEIAALNMIEEVRVRRPLRWAKGFVKGGQFRPTRGGSSARARVLPLPESPVKQRGAGRGRWTWVGGRYTKIPQADAWTKQVDGRTYHSPPGGTNLYRDGELLNTPDQPALPSEKKRSPGVNNNIPPELAAKIEAARASLRGAATGRGEPPVSEGDNASAVLSLEDAGYQLIGSERRGRKSRLRYKKSAGTLTVGVEDAAVTEVVWEPAATNRKREALTQPPADWDEFSGDVLAHADELGERYGAEVRAPNISVDPALADHSGMHEFSGDMSVGRDVPPDIANAARSRAAGKELTDYEKRGVYASYWVTSHEIAHAINPIPPLMFKGANANLEEALAEEISHKLALDRLARHGQYDVIDWRWRNPDALPVRGVYPNERFALQTILDEAGVPIVDRPRIIENLSFRIDPAARLPYLATLHAANTGGDRNKSRERVETLLRNPPRAPRDFRSIINPSATRMLGSGQYGLWEDGKLSENGTVLTLPNGSRRVIEKMDPNWMPGLPVSLEDGKIVGITTYPPGVEITPGEFFANGKAKTFGDFRPIDSTDRAKLMLRGWVGRPEPGAWVVDPDALDRASATIDSDAVASVGDGVPVVRFNDGTYGVGQPHGSSDDRNLTILPNSRDAAELALMRSDLATAADVSTLPTSPVKTFIDDKYAEQMDLFARRVGKKSPGVTTAEDHIAAVRNRRREMKSWRKEDYKTSRGNPIHGFGHVNQGEAKRIGELIEQSALSIRMPSTALSEFLTQGTIKNSLDLGERPKWRIDNGFKNDTYLYERRRFEVEVFGPATHPVYGYFRTETTGPQEDNTRLYGNVIVELDDSVKDRSTYTIGDSLDNREEVIPVPVGEANPLAVHPLGPAVRDVKSLTRIDDLFKPRQPPKAGQPVTAADRIVINGEPTSASRRFQFILPDYAEAQIFGDRPSIDEVRRVIFVTPEDRDVWEDGAWVEKPANWFGPTDAQVKALDKAGIPWEFRATTGKVRKRGKALPAPPQSPGTVGNYDRKELAEALEINDLWFRDDQLSSDEGDAMLGERRIEARTRLGGHLLGYLTYHYEPEKHVQDEYWDYETNSVRPLSSAPNPDAVNPDDIWLRGEETGEYGKVLGTLEVRPLVRRMGVGTQLMNYLRDKDDREIVHNSFTDMGAEFYTAWSGDEVFATGTTLPPRDESEWDGDIVPLTDMLAAKGVRPKGMRSPGVGADRDTGIYPNYNGVKLTMGGGAGGSNGARWATDPEGNRWLVKTYGGDEDRIATELVANRVYNIMGATVADAGIITIDGREALTYKALDGEVQYDPFSDGPNAALGQHYMTDAFLANWDFVGLEDDNILWDADGDPIRVDQGGTLEYRAMGEPKPYEPVPNDVWSMLSKGQAKRATLVTEDQMREQAREIAYRLTPDVIDRLLDDAPFEDDEMRERLRVNMKARVEWMREYGGEQAEVFSVPEGAPVAALFRDSQSGIEVTDAETDSLAFYALGGYEPAQRALRSGEPLEAAPEKAQNAIVALDSLMVSVPEDIYVYVPFDGDADVVGRTVQERGYLHATVEKPDGPAIRLLVPQGARAVNLRELDAPLPDDAPEVVLARGSRMKLTGEDGDVIEGTLVPLPEPPRSPGLPDAYRGDHTAPTAEDSAPLYDMTRGIYPDDIYGPRAAEMYGYGEGDVAKALAVINRVRNKPNSQVTVYRAVPIGRKKQIERLEAALAQHLARATHPTIPGIPEGDNWYDVASDRLAALKREEEESPEPKPTINNGDWVTTVRSYAVAHGRDNLNNDFEVVSKRVPAKHIFTDGNSLMEYGYDPSDLPDPPRSPGTVATRLEQPVTNPEPVIAEARETLEAAGIKVGNPSDEVMVNVITTISDPLEGTEVTREDNVPVASRLTAKNEALFLAGVQDTVARYPQLSEVLKEVTFTTSLTLGSEDGSEVPDTKPDGSDWTGWRRRISRRAQRLRSFAWGTAPVAFYHEWHEDTDDRPFENRIVGKIVLNDFRPTWGEDSAEWFKPLGSDKITANAYGTAVHEVGHAIHSLAERREGKSPFDDGDDSSWQVFRDHDITPDEIGTISDYAVTKPEETFAEMFTAYEADLLDPELAAKFEGLLAEFLGVESPRSPGTVVEYGTVFEANDIRVGEPGTTPLGGEGWSVPEELLNEVARLIEKYPLGGDKLGEITPSSSPSIDDNPVRGGDPDPAAAPKVAALVSEGHILKASPFSPVTGDEPQVAKTPAMTGWGEGWANRALDADGNPQWKAKLIVNDTFNKEDQLKSMEDMVAIGHTLADTYETIGTHEFAHVLTLSDLGIEKRFPEDNWHKQFSTGTDSAGSTDGWDIFAKYGIEPFDVEQVSNYATTEPNEAFAEMFTAYELGLLDDEPVKEKFEALLSDMTGQSVQEALNWREALHPRDRFGRWRDKPGLPKPKTGAASSSPPDNEKPEVREVDAKTFHKAFQKARALPTGAFLSDYSVEEFEEMTTFLSDDGMYGGAVKTADDGVKEAVSLFRLPGGKKGGGLAALDATIKAGAVRLDCLGDKLRETYEKKGFVVIETIPWSDEYAPDGWDYERDERPNVYVMQLVE